MSHMEELMKRTNKVKEMCEKILGKSYSDPALTDAYSAFLKKVLKDFKEVGLAHVADDKSSVVSDSVPKDVLIAKLAKLVNFSKIPCKTEKKGDKCELKQCGFMHVAGWKYQKLQIDRLIKARDVIVD